MSFDESQLVFSFRPGSAACPPERVDLLGGKGASLAALSCAGFPVPPGFTLSTAVCRRFESSSRDWPSGLEAAVRAALAALEQDTGRVLGRGPRPLLVAVRSGAAVSMPGMMDTILNCGLNPSLAEHYGDAGRFWSDYAAHIRQFAASVAGLKLGGDHNRNAADCHPKGDNRDASDAKEDSETLEPRQLAQAYLDEFRDRAGRDFPVEPWDALKQAIDAVFASWNSRRAQVYRERHRISGLAGTAVNVQMMFPADRAGVLFTVDPNAPRSGRMVLEASWGLGEAVVSGEVTPDVYHLDVKSLRIVETVPGQRPRDEPALTEQQTGEIGRLGRRVAEHLGFPADIEWAIAEGEIALLQARAIRGLDVQLAASELLEHERRRLTESASGRTVVWVAHNLGETLPAPTPLTWDFMRDLMSGEGPLGQLYRTLGFEPARSATSECMLELIAGRIYADPRRAARMFFGEVAFMYDSDSLLSDPRTLDGPPSRLDLDQSDPWLFLRLPRLFWKLWKARKIERKLQAGAMTRFTSAVVAPIDAHIGQARRRDLSALSFDELLTELERRRQFVFGPIAAESLLPGYLGGLAQARLQVWFERLFGAEEGGRKLDDLLTGLEGDPAVVQNQRLFEVARGVSSLARFLDEFGHRAAGEMELSQPRWRERPEVVQRMVDGMRRLRHSPKELHAAQAAAREEADSELKAALAFVGGATFEPRIRRDLQLARTLLPYRESGKFQWMRAVETLRQTLEEVARRTQLGDDLYYLRRDELAGLARLAGAARLAASAIHSDTQGSERDGDELRRRIAERKLSHAAAKTLQLPEAIDSRRLELLGDEDAAVATDASSKRTLRARPISSGRVVGVARRVFDPNDEVELGDDFILVCPSTDPGWTPLLARAAGLIVERGGALSHGAIVARDFGLPAVACEAATRRIPDGARIELDARRGLVTLLDDSESATPIDVGSDGTIAGRST